MTLPPKSGKPRYHILSDFEMDEIDTRKQLGTLDRLIEEYQASKRQQQAQPQPPPKPTEDR